MKKEELDFAERYKRVSYKLALGMMIFVIIIGAVIIGVGLFLAIYFLESTFIILGSIMAVVGILDILLAVKFYFSTKKRIARMKDSEAEARYKRIHGIK